ncbi:uncharacterized protein [Phaseolus vulgaris]|uniref:uncharacterized protein n=1 Tax=Phaseolus vulgaris TaxID=3885 RepID=UPI0035CA7690
MDQERIQVDLAASQARKEDLRRTNEELHKNLQQAGKRVVDEQAPPTPPKAFSMPFSQSILDVVIPATFVGPKATFIGVADLEAHLRAFHTQMIMTGGSDAVHCKLYMSTLTGTTLDWFVSLPNGHVTTFAQFFTLFREQYIANRAPPPVFYDLFDVVRLHTKDEDMMMHAFRKGIMSGPFSESLTKSRPKTFSEIRRRAVAHIIAEVELTEKRNNIVPIRPRGPSQPQHLRVHKATTEKMASAKQKPYEHRKAQTRGRAREDRPPRHNFLVELKKLIILNELVKNDFLKDYLLESQGTQTLAAPRGNQGHEMPVHGEIHTISEGLSGGGCTASQRNKYARAVMTVEADQALDIDLVFVKVDLRNFVPHDSDPVVISVVTGGRKVHRVLVDQRSSIDVMYWSNFNKLQLSLDQLRPYTSFLYGFVGDHVEVRGHLELSTTSQMGSPPAQRS